MTNPEQPMRPADSMFPDRLQALREYRCINSPIGCGKKLEVEPLHLNFDNLKSYREYQISSLCQECQNEIFKEPMEDDAPEQLGEL